MFVVRILIEETGQYFDAVFPGLGEAHCFCVEAEGPLSFSITDFAKLEGPFVQDFQEAQAELEVPLDMAKVYRLIGLVKSRTPR